MFALCSLVALSVVGQVSLLTPGPIPSVLLDAPVNATWCANHAAQWKELGVDGFFFRGIVDLSDEREEDHDSHLIHRDDPLLREIDLAQRRLADEGIENNFLRLDLPGDRPLFTDSAPADIFVQRLRRAGAFARDAGLQGVAIATAGEASLFDLRYEAYALDRTGIAAARDAAHAYGQRCVRALIREFRDVDIVILADSPERHGPLWLPFFSGIIQSIGLADSVRIELVLPSGTADTPSEYLERVQRHRYHLEHELGAGAPGELWRSYGALSLSLSPFQATSPRMDAEAFRRLVIAAKMSSSRYVVIATDQLSYMEISPEEAAEYRVLHQQGEGAVRAGLPIPDAAQFHLSTPIDELQRIGFLPRFSPHDYILQNSSGAVALLWEGNSESLAIPGRNRIIQADSLVVGSKQYFDDQDGVITVPPMTGSVLLTGLGLSDWGMAAAMWLAPDAPLEAGGGDTTLRFGFMNPLPVRFTGTLTLDFSGEASVGNASFPILLDPGEASQRERKLRGSFQAGEILDVRMNLLSDDGAVFSRDFHIEVESRQEKVHRHDGTILGPPSIADLDGDGEPEIIVATTAGEIAVYDSEGDIRSRRRYRDQFVASPEAILLKGRGARVFVADHRARMWVTDRSGGAFAQAQLPASVSGPGVLRTRSGVIQDAVFIAPLENDKICGVAPDGSITWERTPFESERVGNVLIFGENELGGGATFAVASSSNSSECVRLDLNGNVLWRQRLEGKTSGAPIALHTNEGNRIVVPLMGGGIQFLDAVAGSSLYLLDPGDDDSVLFLVPVARSDDISEDLVVINENGLRRIDSDGAVQFGAAIPNVVDAVSGSRLMVVQRNGDVSALDQRTGEIAWRQTARSILVEDVTEVSKLPSIVPLDSSAQRVVVTAGRELRILTVP